MKLLISLGHNSSAVLTDGYEVLCGYEEERLSKVKSDSSYPKLAVEEILKFHPEAMYAVTEVHVSHWFWFTDLPLPESKYWQPKHIQSRFHNAVVKTVNPDFTHHDAHANSAWNFSNTKAGLTIVADGFGNNGETLSVYRDGRLIDRKYDYSLGLLYQYMTSALGMKENQDEYKMLGLESHILDNVLLDEIASEFSSEFFTDLMDRKETGFYSVEAVCRFNKSILNNLYNQAKGMTDNDRAYLVQKVLETVVIMILEDYINEEDSMLQFAGGIFYNVKLNNVILNRFADEVDLIEFMPLAGDQGAALGMTPLHFEHFFWGKRSILETYIEVQPGMWFIMKGSMEFGPRALGNTSCIASPTHLMTKNINKLNGRPNIMPMAPMINSTMAEKFCRNISKLGKCKHFMICATDWTGPIADYRGVLHRKPLSEVYTCRPQVIDNEFTKMFGVVINTSLNAHGQPILLDGRDYVRMESIHEQNNSDSKGRFRAI